MEQVRRTSTGLAGAFNILALIYHNTVRNVRRIHGNAIIGLLMNILQTVIFILGFWITMTYLGMRGIAVRGDFVVYLMSGIFVFMTHVKTVGAVSGAETSTSPIMLHAPMNTAISICSAALGTLYLQILSMACVLYGYHVIFVPVTIEDAAGCMGMMLLAWAYGIGVGMVILSLRPWWPEFAMIAQTIYSRANMIASGKMFLANSLSYTMLKIFDWNPLFHLIDQTRGFAFLNYTPHKTSVSYAVYVTLVLIAIGLMSEFYTRKNASASWSAGR
jgi:ABC-type polysaccharide/polyol phosphate export permease